MYDFSGDGRAVARFLHETILENSNEKDFIVRALRMFSIKYRRTTDSVLKEHIEDVLLKLLPLCLKAPACSKKIGELVAKDDVKQQSGREDKVVSEVFVTEFFDSLKENCADQDVGTATSFKAVAETIDMLRFTFPYEDPKGEEHERTIVIENHKSEAEHIETLGSFFSLSLDKETLPPIGEIQKCVESLGAMNPIRMAWDGKSVRDLAAKKLVSFDDKINKHLNRITTFNGYIADIMADVLKNDYFDDNDQLISFMKMMLCPKTWVTIFAQEAIYHPERIEGRAQEAANQMAWDFFKSIREKAGIFEEEFVSKPRVNNKPRSNVVHKTSSTKTSSKSKGGK
ncbi:hypothetical protein PCE1_003281 [Barthelona sp. PCE]